MSNAAEFLVQSQNPDGGWGYRIHGMSYVEPTSAVLLVLSDQDWTRNRARDFLISLQHPDGGWGIGAIDAESGWMTAWAVRALAGSPQAEVAFSRGVSWLLATEGLRATAPAERDQVRAIYQMDSTLRGWPWLPGDASWVHPTALAVLALIAAGKHAEPRVREGVNYLLDRSVASGGWNIGNPEMLGKPIPATVQDTAVALLALHAAGITAAEMRVAAAIQFLQSAVGRAKTAAELTWGIYALRNWGIETGDALERLSALQRADGSWQGNLFITAIALLAGQK